jgi:diguanylate cyclase
MAYYNNAMLENSIEERRIIGEFERALNNEEFVNFVDKSCLFKHINKYCRR